MAKLRRTLIIGLGGTGISAILNAKKMLYENYGEIPPMVGFLGIDTDRPGLDNAFVEASDGTKISLDNSETLPISVDSPRSILQRSPQLFDWMPSVNVSNLDILNIGAGQTRSNGRFALTVNERKVINAINQKLSQINNARILDNVNYKLLGADPEVHMVFSLGGGTGSGTFLNLAYLIKRVLPNVKISGYAVLCDVFRTMAPGAMTSRVRPNGKGALLDLDFLAHLDANSEGIELKWLQQSDTIKERPFSALYLIDNRNENNDTFSEVRPLCEVISLAIVTSVGELGVALDSVADNVNKLISDGAMDIRDKRAWVASFGCSEIIFEGKRLADIYANKACIQLISAMLNGGCDDPVIIANDWFDNNKIRENQGKDDVINYFIENANSPYQFSDIDNPDDPEPECIQFIDTRAMEKAQVLDEKLEQLKNRIDNSLSDLMRQQANRECGVFLCNNILQAILRQVELCDGEMKDEKEELENELPAMESALKSACRELADCMGTLFKRGRSSFEEEVRARTMALARQKREIVRRGMARQFYSWLRIRIGQSLNRVDIIMQNLVAVRQHCSENVQKILHRNGSNSFFQFDLAAESCEKVTCPFCDIVFNDFIQTLRKSGCDVTAFSSMDSSEVAKMLREYVNEMPKVKEYEAMGVDDVLDRMSGEEIDSLVERAVNKTQPLLPYNYRGYEADLRELPVETYYIGVSNSRRSRLGKDGLFESKVHNGEKVQFSEVGLKNRIIIYRQLGVIPAFAVSALDNYDNDYEKWERDRPHGSHWDDKVYQRMIRERYSIFPRDEVSEGKMFRTWIQAIVFGLIQFNNGQYKIKSRALGGQPLNGMLVNMGSTRHEALNFFKDNYDVLLPEIMQTLGQKDIPGPDNQLRILAQRARTSVDNDTYYEEISQCPIAREHIADYPKEYELINKEINYILDNNDFDQL